MKNVAAAVVVALVASATAATASTTSHEATFRFDTSSNGAWVSRLSFSNASGLGLEVFSRTDSELSAGDHHRGSKVRHWSGAGLGAKYRGDSSHTIDAYGDPDNVRLQFSREVQIIGWEFNYVNSWDDFEHALYGDSGRTPAGTFDVQRSFSLADRFLSSSTFEIGAVGHETVYSTSWLNWNGANNCEKTGNGDGKKRFECYSAFKLKSVTVAYGDEPPATVPLPAGGLLLASAFGALGFLRRRKKA